MKLARLVVSLVLYRKLDMDPICLVPTPINTVYMAKHSTLRTSTTRHQDLSHLKKVWWSWAITLNFCPNIKVQNLKQAPNSHGKT